MTLVKHHLRNHIQTIINTLFLYQNTKSPKAVIVNRLFQRGENEMQVHILYMLEARAIFGSYILGQLNNSVVDLTL